MADVVLRLGDVEELLTRPGGPVHAALTDKAQTVVNYAKLLCPVDTGRLRNSIGYEIHGAGRSLTAVVGTDVEYAMMAHEGHGPIVPKRARVLTWQPRAGPRVFAMSVRAVAGKPFLVDALKLVR